MRSFADPDTEFHIEPSDSPVSVDGVALGAPKYLECAHCSAQIRIDGPNGHQAAIDDLPHDHDCDQRDVVSRYYIRKFVET